MKRIGILGAGTWGMALARMLTVSGNDVLVWSAIEKEIDSLSTTRKHPNLPQMKIPDELRFTKSIEEVCKDKDILLFAVPSVFVRSTAAKARPYVADGQIIVDVAKGIEPDTLYTMTEILADELGKEGGPKGVRLVALSGPTHAEEVAIDLPTTIVSASKDMEAAAYVQEVFTNNVMRVYTNEDIKGVELSGARSGRYRRPHRDRHQYAQPQQPRRYPHRQGRDPGKCRQGSRHGGRGHERPARRTGTGREVSGGNAHRPDRERHRQQGHGRGGGRAHPEGPRPEE